MTASSEADEIELISPFNYFDLFILKAKSAIIVLPGHVMFDQEDTWNRLEQLLAASESTIRR